MKQSRRNFIEKVGQGSALSILPLGSFDFLEEPASGREKPIQIGIIGAENSHTIGYGKLFNIDKAFPGVEVTHVWGETEEFAMKAMKGGKIRNSVKDPAEMMGKINALIVDHRHAKYHLKAAEPFVRAGIPTFVDKPFCYRASEGVDFLKRAKESKTPISSYSSVAHTNETFSLREQVSSMKNITQVIMTGPVDLDSEYGNVFFYGVHMVEPLIYIFGEDVETVRVSRNGKNSSASLRYSSGMLVTFIFKAQSRGWETWVENEAGLVQLLPTKENASPARNYTDMVKMFQTGEEPRSYNSILKGVAILEALETSSFNDQWVEVKV